VLYRVELWLQVEEALTELPEEGRREVMERRPASPDLAAESVVATAIDADRYRHPVRFVRLRDDLTPQPTPPFADRRTR